MTIQRVVIVALVLAMICSCASGARQEKVSGADQASALRARLIEKEWRLFSWVYPALPSGGYPIEFEADGRVQTENIASTETWHLAEDLTLQLISKAGVPTMSLSYDSDAGVFVSQPQVEPIFVIDPAGFNFAKYMQNIADNLTPEVQSP